MNSCSVFGEIIQNGYNGYLTPDKDMKVFENKVLQLMSEPSILRQMQLHALESAKKFSLESTMNKWEKIRNDYVSTVRIHRSAKRIGNASCCYRTYYCVLRTWI